MDLKRLTCEYLIKAWYTNKGTPLWTIQEQLARTPGFTYINEALGLSYIPPKLDIFGFIAIYYPKVSNLLLAHKKPDTVTLAKLAELMYRLAPGRQVPVYLLKEIRESKKEQAKHARVMLGRVLLKDMHDRSAGHHWRTVK
jgi:hypothetical protein